MAVRWTLDQGSRNTDADATQAADSLRYVITADTPSEIDPAAILASPTSILGGDLGTTPLPAYRSAHPTRSSMLLDRYNADFDGAVLILTALYSSDGRYRGATLPSVDENDSRWSTTFDYAEYDIPFIQHTPIALSGSTIETIWALQTQRRREKTIRHSATGLIHKSRYGTAISVLFAQKGNVHRIGNEFWLFEGGNLEPSPNDRDYYLCSPSWLIQSGTKRIPVGLDQTSSGTITLESAITIFPSLTSALYPLSGNWSRPPYCDVYYELDSSGDQTVQGDFFYSYQYPVDLNGFNQVASLFAVPLNPNRLP